MNEMEQLAAIQTTLDYLDKKVDLLEAKLDEIRNQLVSYEARMVKREETNSYLEEKIEELSERIKHNEDELDTVKRMAWIGLGIIATLQFLVPFFFQLWR